LAVPPWVELSPKGAAIGSTDSVVAVRSGLRDVYRGFAGMGLA